MTYREQYQKVHPTANADTVHIFQCTRDPNTRQIVDFPLDFSGPAVCRVCWDREMEVTEGGKETLPR